MTVDCINDNSDAHKLKNANVRGRDEQATYMRSKRKND